MKTLIERLRRIYPEGGIRMAVFASFTVSALLAIILTGVTLYARFSRQLEDVLLEENQTIVEQTRKSLNSYLANMIRLSDSINLQVIKNIDVSSDRKESVDEQLQLLYDINSSYVKSIALFTKGGEIKSNAPPARLNERYDVTEESWFQTALTRTENLHFSTPQVQRIFSEADDQYSWVVSLSTAAEITQGKDAGTGVLLISLRYSGIAELFQNVALPNGGYIYLVGPSGEIIYHPSDQLVASGQLERIPLESTGYKNGDYSLNTKSGKVQVILRTVGYTGWLVVGVLPQPELNLSSMQNLLFVLIILLVYFLIILVVNSLISTRLTLPIKKLEKSVQAVENHAEEVKIYIGGAKEIQELGKSVQDMVDIMQRLTKEIVEEQTKKQKSELDALQAQINPHFLYNTLDIIVWMIEKSRPDTALQVVSALARFFRLSLGKGSNIVPVEDELEHVRNYLMIQQYRYKDKFSYEIRVEPEVRRLSTVKLVLQPVVENSVLHGMDFMVDGDGKILIEAFLEDELLLLRVRDNGLGMEPEKIEALLHDKPKSPVSKGSGIGLRNVNERITLYFGEQYGLRIESEPDIGTMVTIRLPSTPYSEIDKGLL